MTKNSSEFKMCEQCGTTTCTVGCRSAGTPNCRTSLLELGKYLFEEKEYYLAILYLERAADRLHPLANKLLGDCYAKGLGVAANGDKAHEYYRLGGCHPSYYEPIIDKANKMKVLSTVVKPIVPVPISNLSATDAVEVPRYLRIRKETAINVSSWEEVARELISLFSEIAPDKLKEIIDKGLDGVWLEEESDREGAYLLRIDESLASVKAIDIILRLTPALIEMEQEIKIWLPIDSVQIPLRAMRKEREEASQKSVVKPVRKKKSQRKAGTAVERSKVPEMRHYPFDDEQDSPESYAEKGIGFVVRDNGRFGSLPTYDDMDE